MSDYHREDVKELFGRTEQNMIDIALLKAGIDTIKVDTKEIKKCVTALADQHCLKTEDFQRIDKRIKGLEIYTANDAHEKSEKKGFLNGAKWVAGLLKMLVYAFCGFVGWLLSLIF